MDFGFCPNEKAWNKYTMSGFYIIGGVLFGSSLTHLSMGGELTWFFGVATGICFWIAAAILRKR